MNVKSEERIRLPQGAQRAFINEVLARNGDLNSLAEFLQVSSRTVRDWRREKFLMSYQALMQLCEKYAIPLPENMTVEDPFWYAAKGASAGGKASYLKQGGQIGDPEIRKQKWFEWWEREGKFSPLPQSQPLTFIKPEKSVQLAEFMGTMMGDGGMNQYQAFITLHHIDDLDYSKFVIKTIEQLFGLIPAVYHRVEHSVNIITISRSGLVKYLHELGLPIGNKVKQRFDIPDWIKENREYMIACVRGLVDTDGSVFTHRYRVNSKLYAYKKICFSSSSPPLIKTVHDFLTNEGFYARISRAGVHIRIESISGVKKYFELIGSHNAKHLKRYEK